MPRIDMIFASTPKEDAILDEQMAREDAFDWEAWEKDELKRKDTESILNPASWQGG